MNFLAAAYGDQGETKQTEELYGRVLGGRRRVLGAGHPSTLTSMNDLAGMYLAQGRYAQAEPMYDEVLRTRQPEARFDCQSTLGAALTGERKYAEAEPLLLAAFESLRQHSAAIPRNERALERSIGWIIELYGDWEWRIKQPSGGTN